MNIDQQPFGVTTDGTPVELYRLTNDNGVEAGIMTYGGIIVSLHTPDRDGQFADVTLGFETLEPYLERHPYFGALIGRFGNRIAKGRFELNGQTYQLAQNDGSNHLHGGVRGFDTAVWRASHNLSDEGAHLSLTHVSPSGDEGYPGTLTVNVVYTLTNQNELHLDYTATTNRDTVLNLSNHAYFNLAVAGDILGHEIQLMGSKFLPVDATLIPTGEFRPVAGTPMDFTTSRVIGARVDPRDEQITLAVGGFDHNWVLDHPAGILGHAARVYDPASWRVMDVYTTQPGVQFYTGNMLDGTARGKNGKVYAKHTGFCLETQHFPDAPNQPQFPSTVLRPGETYRHTTIYRFSTR